MLQYCFCTSRRENGVILWVCGRRTLAGCTQSRTWVDLLLLLVVPEINLSKRNDSSNIYLGNDVIGVFGVQIDSTRRIVHLVLVDPSHQYKTRMECPVIIDSSSVSWTTRCQSEEGIMRFHWMQTRYGYRNCRIVKSPIIQCYLAALLVDPKEQFFLCIVCLFKSKGCPSNA